MRYLSSAMTVVSLALLVADPTSGGAGAVLTSPPHVPAAITRSEPAKVIVELETRSEGTAFRRRALHVLDVRRECPRAVRLGAGRDTVQIRLKNDKSSRHAHSIDLHAVTGPGGGATVSLVAAGEEKAFEWRALSPGLFVYHCAGPSTHLHVANGMYGLVLVEPTDGLARVDREYYVMQGEFYTRGATLARGHQAFDPKKARAERPEHVVFNGRVGSLLDEGALKANVGETVRLYVGNGGPNPTSAFHVIGEIFDTVYREGGLGQEPSRNIQTTLIPP